MMKPYYQDNWVTIYHGDCREILPELPKVDLVLTDPPYPKEYDYVWDILPLCADIMNEGASLLTLCGHYQIPRVIDALRTTLTYHWMCNLPNNNQPIMHGWNIKVCWKPILWFAKGIPRKHELIYDNFALMGKRETLWIGNHIHKWGQSEEMALKPIIQLTQDGELVLDPFLGSGTTCYCAKKLNRKSIGIEIEEKYCEVAAKRCSQSVFNLNCDGSNLEG